MSEYDEIEDDSPEAAAVATDTEASNTEGETLLATPFGYAFASSDNTLPTVTYEGIKVSAAEAEFILLESDEHDGKVFVVTEKED